MIADATFSIPWNRTATPSAITLSAGLTSTALTDDAVFGILDAAGGDLSLVGLLLYNASAPADDTDVRWGGAEGAEFPLPAGTERWLGCANLSDVYIRNGGGNDATLHVALFFQADDS